MRLFIISFILAFIFCLPLLGTQMDFAVPLRGLLYIPYTGLDYMLIFFHEIGHTLMAWLFGYPAIPRFDFEHGGGYSHYYDRSFIILGLFWLCVAALAVKLYKDMHYRLLIWLCTGMGLHILFALTPLHNIVISFMGHGTEVLIGGFCMLRAFWNTTEKSRGAAERWLNMIFGIFAQLHNMILTAGLMASDVTRAAYAAQKGGHLQGDLDRIGTSLHISVQTVAGVLFLLSLAVFVGTVYMGVKYLPHQPQDDF